MNGVFESAPALAIPPSFMLSGLVPIFYTVVQAIVEKLPWVPAPSFGLELSLAIHDAFSRSFLLCNLIPPMVLEHTSPAIRENPWTLLLTALVCRLFPSLPTYTCSY